MGEQSFNNAKYNMINGVIDELIKPESYKQVFHQSNHDTPMPSIIDLTEIMRSLKTVIFPGSFGISEVTPENLKYYIGTNLDKISHLLTEQIKRGYCFSCDVPAESKCNKCESKAQRAMLKFIEQLPRLRYLLSRDVNSAYIGDPAAKNPGETIFCYPSIIALIHHRIAHELFLLEVPIIPRIISEMAHSKTGIDIHPGAVIGEGMFIDHGTGTVIGETCIIGKNVRIYHGVTLGAKSFPKDEEGNLLKGLPRHPLVKDDVVIYAGTTVLGRVTIGKGTVIGGNMWITQDVEDGVRLMPGKNK